MKKILAIAFAVVVVAVAIWTASWLLGRSKIETGIEDQLARADTQGWSVTIGERSIRGFPSAYVIEMTDVAAVRRADGLASPDRCRSFKLVWRCVLCSDCWAQ